MTYSGDLRRSKFLKICRQFFVYMQRCYSLGDLLELLSRKSTGMKFVNNLQKSTVLMTGRGQLSWRSVWPTPLRFVKPNVTEVCQAYCPGDLQGSYGMYTVFATYEGLFFFFFGLFFLNLRPGIGCLCDLQTPVALVTKSCKILISIHKGLLSWQQNAWF